MVVVMYGGVMYGGDDVWWGWCMVWVMYGGVMYGGDDVWWG